MPVEQDRSAGEHWRGLAAAQRHAFFASFLGWTLDSFDYFLLVFSLSAISAEFHASTANVAEALFLTLAFRPLGALLFGFLAERYGRRRILLVNIASFATLGLLSAFAPTLPLFLLLRALFGVAMGGEWGVGAALVFETLPTERRGLYSGILQQGYSSGSLLASLAFGLLAGPLSHVRVAGHIAGWRGLFVIGAIFPALLIVYIARYVQESPVWLAARTRPGIVHEEIYGDAVNRNPGTFANICRYPNILIYRYPNMSRLLAAATTKFNAFLHIFTDLRRYMGVFLFLVLLMTGFNALSHGSTDLYPTFLIRNHGAGPHVVGLIGIVFNIGAIFGGITFGALSERWGRKRAIVTAALLTLPSIPLYALAHSLPLLALGSFLVLFTVQGAWGVVPAYLNELSPGPVRAIFPGLVYQLGNLLASRINVLQAKAAVSVGSLGPVLAVTVFAAALYLALVASLGRESRGEVMQ